MKGSRRRSPRVCAARAWVRSARRPRTRRRRRRRTTRRASSRAHCSPRSRRTSRGPSRPPSSDSPRSASRSRWERSTEVPSPLLCFTLVHMYSYCTSLASSISYALVSELTLDVCCTAAGAQSAPPGDHPDSAAGPQFETTGTLPPAPLRLEDMILPPPRFGTLRPSLSLDALNMPRSASVRVPDKQKTGGGLFVWLLFILYMYCT